MSSSGAIRKNGKQASCEPCRKRKIACERSSAASVCARCRRRRTESECWTHPHPLTKANKTTPDPEPVNRYSSPRSPAINQSPRNPATSERAWSSPYSLSSVGPRTAISEAETPLFSALRTRAHEETLKLVEEVLSQLRYLDVIEHELFPVYYKDSQAALCPFPLMAGFVKGIRKTDFIPRRLLEGSDEGVENISQLAEATLKWSSAKIEITPDLTPSSFCMLFSGEHLRIETLGLLFTIAARACLYRLARDDDKHWDFVMHAIRASKVCLRLSRQISPQITDVMVWLAYEEMQLTTLVDGDACLSVWRRLGEVTSDIFAAGFHRELPGAPVVPFFLKEIRRRTFASAYRTDKAIARFLDWPFRITGHFYDFTMPLDLTDHEICSQGADLEHALSNVGPDGWNVQERYGSSTWARMRYLLSQFQEEISVYGIRSLGTDDESKLADISRRCDDMYKSIPLHLQYHTDCWQTVPPSPCFMLVKTYLAYLQIDFQINQLLAKNRGQLSSALVKTASQMLDTVLQISGERDRAVHLVRDLPTVMFAYGVPSASTLVKALHETIRDSTQTQSLAINRSKLIKDLSIFTSQLHSICGPSQLNYEVCVEASKTISKTLDDVLDSLTMPSSTVAANSVLTPVEMDGTLDQDVILIAQGSREKPTDLNNLNAFDMQNLDFADWSKTIDWTGGIWDTFE